MSGVEIAKKSKKAKTKKKQWIEKTGETKVAWFRKGKKFRLYFFSLAQSNASRDKKLLTIINEVGNKQKKCDLSVRFVVPYADFVAGLNITFVRTICCNSILLFVSSSPTLQGDQKERKKKDIKQ